MMRFILYLASAVTFLFTQISCLHEYDPYYYETVDMILSNADNSGEGPIDAGSSVSKEAYGIKLDYSMVLKVEGEDQYESSYVNEDDISDVNVYCLDTFNTIPPLNSLNNLFNYSTGGPTGSIIESPYYRIADAAVRGANEWNATHYLFLMEPPTSPGNFSFVFDILFTDGRTLKDTINVNLF